MLNHARTLLMNVPGSAPYLDVPGEEIVDYNYRQLSLPLYLDILRYQLFGANPDRHMLNYRCWQLLSILHDTSLVPYVLALDPRITYNFKTAPFLRSNSVNIVKGYGAADDHLNVVGTPDVSDVSGVMHQRYLITFSDADTIFVERTTAPISKVPFSLTITDGLSNLISLTGTDYGFYLNTNNINQSWSVDLVDRPQRDLGEILANITELGQGVLGKLFGLEKWQPMATCRSLWNSNKELPLKLSSVLLAMIYRTELIRLNDVSKTAGTQFIDSTTTPTVETETQHYFYDGYFNDSYFGGGYF